MGHTEITDALALILPKHIHLHRNISLQIRNSYALFSVHHFVRFLFNLLIGVKNLTITISAAFRHVLKTGVLLYFSETLGDLRVFCL